MQHTIILCPLYNDQDCFNIFASEIKKITSSIEDNSFSFLVINDGSGNIVLSSELPLTIVHLHRNIGHQKAITIGLAYAQEHLKFDHIIVMDVDGEDRPEDIPLLMKAQGNREIVVAKRVNRQEGRSFRVMYIFYKLLFRILTGKKISFGNFMILSRSAVSKIVHYSEVWNHLAGGVVKSNIPYTMLKTNRGKRYMGNSKMNFHSLLLHGLGAIGVFIELTAMRLLLFSIIMIIASLVTIAIIFFIKFFTDEAIPGWATSAVTSMLIILMQSFLLSLFTIFLYLSSQSQKKFIPAHHYQDYVQSIENIH